MTSLSTRERDGNLLTADRVADPYPYLHELRASDPVHWSRAHHAWLITRFDDVYAALRDRRFSSDRATGLLTRIARERGGQLPQVFALLSEWLVFKDQPDHTRLRQLAGKAFTKRSVENIRDELTTAVRDLLAGLPDEGDFDLMDAFASRVPSLAIARILGVPPADAELFHEWSDALTGLIFGAAEADDRLDRAEPSLRDMATYLRERAERLRLEPDGSVLAALATAEADNDALSMDEVVGTSMLLLFAGHESTASLITTAVLTLLRHRDQLALLCEDESLIPDAVEEVLRYDGSTKIAVRTVAEAHEMRDKNLGVGDRVFLVAAAADRDPERFPDPDRFDILRADKGHVNFGTGIHFCLGAPLARLEMELALRGLVPLLPHLEVAVPHVEWRPTLVSRSLSGLPLRWVDARRPTIS